MKRAVPPLVVALLAGALLAGCERGGEVIVAPGQAPGVAAPTYEAVLDPALVGSWIDSSFIGFASPANATFLQVEEGTDQLASRGLLRFGFIQDTVFIDSLLPAESFDSVRIVFTLDSTRTELASAGTTLQLVQVLDEWDRGSANWQYAIDSAGVQVAWTAGPGGSFGAVLGDTLLSEEEDSVVVYIDVDPDSLLHAWLDTTQANNGLGVLVGDSGIVVLQLPRIYYNIIPETQPDTAVLQQIFATDGTFIFDRTEEGSSSGMLRIGGVDGWRPFIRIALPDSVQVEGQAGKVLLRGAKISKAQLFLTSLAPPAPPFNADQLFFGAAYGLAADFTVLGAKTPVSGREFNSDFEVNPDSLVAGDTIAVNLTALVQNWAGQPLGTQAVPVSVSLRALPEATTFGYWDFGGAEGDPQAWPVLRIVFTRPTDFLLP